MPSVLERIRGVGENGPNLTRRQSVVLGLLLSLLIIELVIALCIKAHVILNVSRELFFACGYEAIGSFYNATVIITVIGFFSWLLFFGGFLLCDDPYDTGIQCEGDWKTITTRMALLLTAITLVGYWIMVVTTVLVYAGSGTAVEEVFFFYPDFYAPLTISGNCTPGEDLYELELAVGVLKAESCMIMLVLLLIGPICCCCCLT